MKYKRKVRKPFELTPTEQAILELHREFPKLPVVELYSQLGLSRRSGLLITAIEKDRLLVLAKKEGRRHGKLTTLKVARRVHVDLPKNDGPIDL